MNALRILVLTILVVAVRTETGLISYWPLDEEIDSTAVDVTSKNNSILIGGVNWIHH